MFRTIESRDNPVYRQLKALRQPRKTRAAGLVFVEGFRQAEELLRAGYPLTHVLLTPAARQQPRWLALAAAWPEQLATALCLEMPDRLFSDLVATESPQGIALLARSPLAQAVPAAPCPDGLYLIVESIQDPGNLGTLIRTADAFAFDAVLILDGTTDPFGEKALRAAMGSTFHLPLFSFPDIVSAAAWLDQCRIPVLAADLHGEDLLDLPRPIAPPAALVIGNEGGGLSAAALTCAHRRLRIPMPGQAESLNAAAAAAILCFELLRGRRQSRLA